MPKILNHKRKIESNHNNKNLDIELFRAYAIVITIIAHFRVLVPEYYLWSTYFWLGGGVDLFFAISGFLITCSLLESVEVNKSFWIYAKLFWVRRIFRLWPAALFWSTCILSLSFFFDFERTFGSRELVFNSWLFGVLNVENLYIYTCANQLPPCRETPLWHYWSLSLEEQFYLLLPFIIFFTPQRKLLIWPCLFIAVCQAISVRPWGGLLWFIRSDALMYGTAVAIGWRYYKSILELVFRYPPRWFLQLLLAIFSVLLIILARKDVSLHYHGLVAISAGIIVFIVSLDACLFTKSKISSFIAKYIGSRSYSLYLVHMPVFYIIREMIITFGLSDFIGNEIGGVFTIIIGVIVSLILAEFSFRFIESPLRWFGRRITI